MRNINRRIKRDLYRLGRLTETLKFLIYIRAYVHARGARKQNARRALYAPLQTFTLAR